MLSLQLMPKRPMIIVGRGSISEGECAMTRILFTTRNKYSRAKILGEARILALALLSTIFQRCFNDICQCKVSEQ